MSDELKYTVLSKLLSGESPSKITADIDEVPYSTILRWKRELDEARLNGSIADLINLDSALVGELIQQVKDNSPAELSDAVESSLGEVRKMKNIGDALQEDLQRTASQFNTKIRTLALSTTSISELQSLTTILVELQTAFFNKNQTQVNVQNNYGSQGDSKYGAFLSDKPGNN